MARQMRYQPTITVAGFTLSPDWSTTDLVGVRSGVTIDWGRNNHYEQVPPAELKLTFFDPAGIKTTEDNLQGAEVTVVTELGCHFRGVVDYASWSPTQVWDERTHSNVNVWKVTIHASDMAAEIAKTVAPINPMQGWWGTPPIVPADSREFWQVTGQWPIMPSKSTDGLSLREQMIAAVVPRFVTSVESSFPYAQASRPASMFASLWDALSYLIALYPLSFPSYDPYLDRIQLTRPAPAAQIRLRYEAGRLVLRPHSDTALLVPAKLLEVEPGAEVVSTMLEQITTLEIEHQYQYWQTHTLSDGDPRTDWDYTNTTIHTTDVIPMEERRPSADRVLRLRTPLSGHPTVQTDPESPPFYFAGPQVPELAADTADIVRKLNGMMPHPPFTVDLDRIADDIDEELARLFLRTSQAPHGIYLDGSLYTGIGTISPYVQIVGGTLDLTRKGWRHTLRTTPLPLTGTPVDVDGLVTNPTPTMADYADSITLGNLGRVTEGAS